MRSDANAVDMQSLIVGAFMAIRYFYNCENTKHAAYEPRYLNTVSIPQIETGAFWYCSYTLNKIFAAFGRDQAYNYVIAWYLFVLLSRRHLFY
jgi:hypothetical protein